MSVCGHSCRVLETNLSVKSLSISLKMHLSVKLENKKIPQKYILTSCTTRMNSDGKQIHLYTCYSKIYWDSKTSL